MDEFLPIKKYAAKFVQLSEDEEAHFASFLRIKKIKRKRFIVNPGNVCKHKSFIVKGDMRAYLVDNAGQEHTLALAIEDRWISDYSSFLNQEPATLFVEALEDTP